MYSKLKSMNEPHCTQPSLRARLRDKCEGATCHEDLDGEFTVTGRRGVRKDRVKTTNLSKVLENRKPETLTKLYLDNIKIVTLWVDVLTLVALFYCDELKGLPFRPVVQGIIGSTELPPSTFSVVSFEYK
ncbi:hypothetical protein NE237_021589 [Protea cynaroides]|uniref:Uncharacterized protein n=1 Tax=Protea cynaroides TaxID=273540 RepID=A0A9Q0H9C6_9MAGN|nr:hypothetical protein NE237_021589 [Protea cynaroides]